jgi:ParB family chromosome partitioning protein
MFCVSQKLRHERDCDKARSDTEYVKSILYLLKHGENSLVSAVERGLVPPTLALEIAKTRNAKLQGALLEAYFNGRHTTKQIATVRRLVEQRIRRIGLKATLNDRQLTPAALMRAYRQEAQRQKILACKADITQARLLFIVNPLKASCRTDVRQDAPRTVSR